MRVDHLVQVTQRHMLKGKCPACGSDISTDHPDAIKAFDAGRDQQSKCGCGALLNVLGSSKILTPNGGGTVAQLNAGPNRHQRRANLVLAKR
jgi:hypothetical protein